jgi:ABC-type spermidine/putrescine transport system permease subunit II
MSVLIARAFSATVTWIRVPKRSFNFAEVILLSLQIAALCAAVALVLGTVLGVVIIVHRRHQTPAQDRLHVLDISH